MHCFDILNIECTFNVTQHSIKRHQERTSKNEDTILSTVIRIIELGMKDKEQQFNNLIKFIKVFNKWKNKKENYKHEGKCILLYEEKSKIYKISCGINITIIYNTIHLSFTFPTFMNVWNTALNYINHLKLLKKNAIRDNMYITTSTLKNEYNIFITPDK